MNDDDFEPEMREDFEAETEEDRDDAEDTDIESANGITALMRGFVVLGYVTIMCLTCLFLGSAGLVRDTDRELRYLRGDIQLLRVEVKELTEQIDKLSTQRSVSK